MPSSNLRLGKYLDMIFHTAQDGEIVFIYMKDVHGSALEIDKMHCFHCQDNNDLLDRVNAKLYTGLRKIKVRKLRRMKIRLLKDIDRGTIILTVIFLLCFPIFFMPWVHGIDPVGYYSWIRSLIIDGNLDISNEFNHFGTIQRGFSPTGYTYNEYPIGSALLWLPFFLFAHFVSRIAELIGFHVVLDGYGAQYIWAVSLGSVLYAFVGIVLIYRLCKQFFSTALSALAVASVWLSSPLLFYMYCHPVMSHANDFFAYSLFLFVWYKTSRWQNCRAAALRGASAGLCALIRQQNAVLVFFLLGEYVIEGIRAYRGGAGLTSFRASFKNLTVFSLTWWAIFLPQLIVWKVVFGQWFVWNPYGKTVSVGFDWLHPHCLEVLFSTDRGLFVWAPILLLGTAGFFLLRRQNTNLALLLIVNVCLQMYVVSSWTCWNGAVSFGPRLFINMLPGFMLGFAALIDAIEKHKSVMRKWLVGLCTVFVAWNFMLIVRYALEDLPRSGAIPIEKLILGQFNVIVYC